MRSKHLVDGQPKYTNALVHETSPYLLQHAHNPVAWRPWSTATLEESRRTGKPIFLSIGYSTCHWCHVMEEESFEDEEVAAALNDAFIPIKVDREERPDVDGIYMTAVQALTGRGGWPMSVFLTPEGKPFFAGTYFPARDGDRGSNLGFLSIIRRLGDAWTHERGRVASSADEIAAELTTLMRAPAPTDMPPLAVVDRAVDFFAGRYDDVWGGLHPAPKFPSSLPIRVLLRHHARTGMARSLDMALTSFHKMADGGLYDQVGGGFHRYSTDERWLVPHFEKMLYDNALLVTAGVELWQATADARVAWVVKDTLRYIERDMTSPEGAFYCATDADSLSPSGAREEGWFFTWTPDELVAELGETRAAVCMRAWAVAPRGNFEGRSIPWRPKPVSADDDKVLLECREILYRARSERPAPLRDEKILAGWNGLMISALARAAFAFDEPAYALRAIRAADFILGKMRDERGRIMRTSKGGTARHAGTLDDHAMVIEGLIDLWETTGTRRFLDEALALERVVADAFEDKSRGGFFLTAHDGEVLLAREKPSHDGAEPSGNSVHAHNLARLAVITDSRELRQRAERTVCSVGQILGRHPGALSELLIAVEFLLTTPKEIVVVTPNGAAPAASTAVVAPLRTQFLGSRVLVQVPEADVGTSPLAAGRIAVDGKSTVYVCEQRTCRLPATSADDVRRALSGA